MAISIVETSKSRQWSSGALVFEYRLTGTTDESAAMLALLGGTATEWEGLVREPYPSLDPQAIDTVTGRGEWLCKVRYLLPADAQNISDRKASIAAAHGSIGDVRIRGAVKGHSQHVQSSLATTAAYGVGAAVDDFGNLVSVQPDGAVDGADIDVSAFEFTVVKVHGPAALPSLDALDFATNCLNISPFSVTDTQTGLSISRDTGEVRFRGFSFGNVRGDGGIEFEYDFVSMRDRAGITIGEITDIAIDGHEYTWIRTEAAEVGGLKTMGRKPVAVYTERMYHYADFDVLGL